MEGPIIDYGAYSGPRVGSSKTFVGELKNMGIRIMTTANNHAMDAGPEGVFMTNRFLDEAGTPMPAPAGISPKRAVQPSPQRRKEQWRLLECIQSISLRPTPGIQGIQMPGSTGPA
jgi:hypothetical protein